MDHRIYNPLEANGNYPMRFKALKGFFINLKLYLNPPILDNFSLYGAQLLYN